MGFNSAFKGLISHGTVMTWRSWIRALRYNNGSNLGKHYQIL